MGEDPDWRRRSSLSPSRLLSLFLAFCFLLPISEGHVICGSIDIRNDARTVFNKENASDEYIARYSNCTILEGTFSLSMITNSSTREEEFVTFPNLVEITGYLLVFNVKSLTSLSRIFPNLRVIGGSQLIMNYALIVYQNPDLTNVGLPNLRVIRNGGVRISENPSLCYVLGIDWKRMTFGSIDDVLVSDGASTGAQCGNDECDDKFRSNCVMHPTPSGTLTKSCWDPKTCQDNCTYDMLEVNSNSSRKIGPGCLIGPNSGNESLRCHPECIGGCYELDEPSQCVACAGFLYDGKCVPECPPSMFKYLSRCVTREECIDSPEVRLDDEWRQYKAVDRLCTYDCPPGYEQKRRKVLVNATTNLMKDQEYCEVCQGDCPKKCKGKALDTIAMAKDLEGCNVVEGNLDIQLKDNSKMSMLTDYLKNIEIIEGNLLVRFSPSLTSLSIFKNLKEIRGNELFQNRYALVIYENQNLNSLFSTEVVNRLNITAGAVQVQNNRMLCFKHVKELMDRLNEKMHVNDTRMVVNQDDQSTYSNGDKAICEETSLVLSHEKLMSEGFILKWTPLNTSDIDHRKFLGYQVFYKRVLTSDVNEIQIEQDRSVCSDTWNMHFEPEKNQGETPKREENVTLTKDEEARMLMNPPSGAEVEKAAESKKKTVNGLNPGFVHAVITHDGIMPNAYYAAYVQTKMVNHPGAKNARSNVIIVQTQFSNPTPPRIVDVKQQGTDKLEVSWDEPLRPNGNITHYIVTWHTQYKDISYDVTHACDAGGARKPPPEVAPTSTTLPPNTSPVGTTLYTVLLGRELTKDDEGFCKEKGCCMCSKTSVSSSIYGTSDDDVAEDLDNNHDFENAVQNIVFVPSDEHHPKTENVERKKRSISGGEQEKGEGRKEEQLGKSPEGDETESATPTVIMEEDTGEIERDDVKMSKKPGYLLDVVDTVVSVSVNHTVDTPGRQTFMITGLKHATSYQVSVTACQDIDVEPHFCSLKPAYKLQKTLEQKGNDKVPAANITSQVLKYNTTGTVYVQFEPPSDPNGKIHGFTVTIKNKFDEQATPLSHCVNSTIFAGGAIIGGLAEGTYEPWIVTITASGRSDAVKGEPFTIVAPPFLPLPILITIILVFIILVGIIAFAIMQTTQTMVGKKIGEYVRNTMTANPDYERYLAQCDVYKADEWELERSSLTLGEEIGRGTFGKVYRGWGDQIRSQCGTVFSECAIKTVSEEANPAERLHFLIEASVMKQFNSSFIIHLYGVVSDGQPVLVVMEMMAKGNLRDYLRSRRPGEEENVENLPLPTDKEIMEWAAQIADGMSYLEYLKFVHRDLAARNCMIGADDVVKIGDFGMARDIYYHEYYKPTGKRMMPVRWMAPESLKDGKFSLKSDVWAYGIVLYEMMTLAQQPYQGLANDEVFNFIGVTRRTLDRPEKCPDFWYELMLHCWQYQPRDRPTFRQIVECLCLRASDDFRRQSWVLNEAPLADGEMDGEERHEEIIDEDVREMFCTDNRRGREDEDEYGERGVELINSEEEDSV